MIIGLSGKKHSGKTEISKYLSEKLNIPVYSFATPVKILVNNISGLTDNDKTNEEYYTGKTFNIEPLKKELKKYGYDKLSIEEIDNLKAIEYLKISEIYRNLLQYIGSNIFRTRNINHWVIYFKSKYSLDESYIVDDIRFINEFTFINSQHESKCVKVINSSTHKRDYHISETEMDRIRFKYKFINKNNGLTQLYNDIDNLFGI